MNKLKCKKYLLLKSIFKKKIKDIKIYIIGIILYFSKYMYISINSKKINK